MRKQKLSDIFKIENISFFINYKYIIIFKQINYIHKRNENRITKNCIKIKKRNTVSFSVLKT